MEGLDSFGKTTASLIADEELVFDDKGARLWKELPSTVLCHILQQIPYKRADVKGVCSSWRTAINRSLNIISMPAADLPLLSQLPDIKHLTVTGAEVNRHTREEAILQPQQQQPLLPTWPPTSCWSTDQAASASTSHSGDAAPATSNDDAVASCWAAVEPRLLNRLQSLRLLRCPQVVQQLAGGLLQPLAQQAAGAASSSSSGGRWSAPLPAFTALQVLEVDGEPSMSPIIVTLLDALQQQCTAAAAAAAAGSCTDAERTGAPLQKLQALHIQSCSSQDSWRGSDGINDALQMLPQLPALHTLQLSACVGLLEVPPAVLHCTGLTKLVLHNNELVTELPAGISQLTALQVLDLSCAALLRNLGSGFSSLTSLTELNLSGPSGLWADYSTAAPAATAAACVPATHAASDAAYGTDSNNPQPGLGGHATAVESFPAAALTAGCCTSPAAVERAALPQLLLPPLPHQQQLLLLRDLATLQQLRRLVLAHNRQLVVLPGALSALTGLTQLDAGGCGLRWLGDEVLACSGLQELLLADNVLVELPDDVSRLQSLLVLDVGRCSSLWRLPSSLLRLSQLERLVVPSKAIAQYVCEQLECRAQPVQVDMEPGDADSDDGDDWDAPGSVDYDSDDELGREMGAGDSSDEQ